MKKTLFLSVMIMLLGGGLLFAQNTIDVSGLKVEAGTVTFKVEWSNAGASNLWSDTVWVFVDYNKNGKMTRMPLEPGSTLTATSSPGVGKLVEENVKGAWVVGDARTNGSFSATVQLLTATADLYGACAYASSYPPVGQYVSGSEIIFSGTPWYELKLLHEDGNTIETIESGGTFLLPCSYTMSSFTDATGAPGIFNCIRPVTYTLSGLDVCEGTAVTLTLSGSQSGWQYRLYDGTTPVGSAVPGTDGALIFTDVSAAVGGHSYTVRTVDGAGVRCDMPVSNALNVTVTAIPSTPAAAPTQNGPKCAGTGITFSASVPGDATGLDWTGSVSGTGTSKTTATTAGTYSAQVRSYLTSGTTCYSGWSGEAGGTITAIPSVPSTPSQNGPKCAGTGITFSASVPSGATGLDWTGSVSGTGTSKTTATTAGTYSAQVRSYLTSGTTCYSGWSGTATSTINSLAGTNQANNGCCTSGLTACNGYCRNLVADEAVCYNNKEIRQVCLGGDVSGCTPSDPSYSRVVFSIAETQTILALIKSAYGIGHIIYTSETIDTSCRYACDTNAGCTCYPGGNKHSFGWFGAR